MGGSNNNMLQMGHNNKHKMENRISNLVTLLYTDSPRDYYIPVKNPRASLSINALCVEANGVCQVRCFFLQLKRVTFKHRVEAWKALVDIAGCTSRYKWMAELMLHGTLNQQEPHLKRRDRFKVVAFCYANGISPFVLRRWLWVTGLLQTSDYVKTLARWKHVESLFVQFEQGKVSPKFPTYEMEACCNGAWANCSTHCYCKYRGKKTSAQTGRIMNVGRKQTSLLFERSSEPIEVVGN